MNYKDLLITKRILGGHNLETTNKGTGEMNTGLTLYKHSLVYYFYAIFSFSYLILQRP